MAGGSSPFFVAKFAPANNGSLQQLWNEKFNGTYTFVSGVAVDLQGNVYTMGSFEGSVDFDPSKGKFILQSASYT